jgi:hypothetical protein
MFGHNHMYGNGREGIQLFPANVIYEFLSSLAVWSLSDLNLYSSWLSRGEMTFLFFSLTKARLSRCWRRPAVFFLRRMYWELTRPVAVRTLPVPPDTVFRNSRLFRLMQSTTRLVSLHPDLDIPVSLSNAHTSHSQETLYTPSGLRTRSSLTERSSPEVLRAAGKSYWCVFTQLCSGGLKVFCVSIKRTTVLVWHAATGVLRAASVVTEGIQRSMQPVLFLSAVAFRYTVVSIASLYTLRQSQPQMTRQCRGSLTQVPWLSVHCCGQSTNCRQCTGRAQEFVGHPLRAPSSQSPIRYRRTAVRHSTIFTLALERKTRSILQKHFEATKLKTQTSEMPITINTKQPQPFQEKPTSPPPIKVFIRVLNVGVDSSVSIVTRYGLDGPGIESRWGHIFRTRPDCPWGPPSLH